jgi:hypothetical protein
MQAAYDEILDFVTSAPTLAQILAFTHSEITLQRVDYLIRAEKASTLTPEERDELREFQKADHFMEQLKIRATRRLERPLSSTW